MSFNNGGHIDDEPLVNSCIRKVKTSVVCNRLVQTVPIGTGDLQEACISKLVKNLDLAGGHEERRIFGKAVRPWWKNRQSVQSQAQFLWQLLVSHGNHSAQGDGCLISQAGMKSDGAARLAEVEPLSCISESLESGSNLIGR